MKWIRLILRILISAFFVISAIGKLMSIEAFEVYLYRITFLEYDIATMIARLLIGAEFIIGLGLLLRLKFRFVWWAAFLALLLFSIFLSFQAIQGPEDNCFCLGELVDLTPLESLAKNMLLIVWLVFIRKTKPLVFRWKNLLFGLMIAGSVVMPFVISPPDLFVKGRFNPAEHDQSALNEALVSGRIPREFTEGKKVLSFYSTGCKFCRMASTRMATMVRKADIDTTKLHVVFWGDSTVKALEFYEETHSPHYVYSPLDTETYLDITKGRMPLILLIENGKVKHEMNYRTIDETVIEEFLKVP